MMLEMTMPSLDHEWTSRKTKGRILVWHDRKEAGCLMTSVAELEPATAGLWIS